jgi:hypothetical protein
MQKGSKTSGKVNLKKSNAWLFFRMRADILPVRPPQFPSLYKHKLPGGVSSIWTAVQMDDTCRASFFLKMDLLYLPNLSHKR